MYAYMSCVLEMRESSSGKQIFVEESPAFPFAQFHIFRVLGKEELGDLADVGKTVNERTD